MLVLTYQSLYTYYYESCRCTAVRMSNAKLGCLFVHCTPFQYGQTLPGTVLDAQLLRWRCAWVHPENTEVAIQWQVLDTVIFFQCWLCGSVFAWNKTRYCCCSFLTTSAWFGCHVWGHCDRWCIVCFCLNFRFPHPHFLPATPPVCLYPDSAKFLGAVWLLVALTISKIGLGRKG